MDLSLLIDPLFRLPLVAGLLAAMALPLLGTLLRLRDEWLAALGLAHVSAAAGLSGLAFGVPIVVGAPLGAAAAAVVKFRFAGKGNTSYALMILIGWSATLLIAANTALGEALAHAMADGQLYFTYWPHVIGWLLLSVCLALGLPWLMPRLIRARFFPEHDRANQLPAWRWNLGFDLLVAVAMALGTSTVGLMGAFALIFVPPWVAFRTASSWRSTLGISTFVGVSAYFIAFVLAMVLDQPFGPVMVAVLLLQVPLVLLIPSAAWAFGALHRGGHRGLEHLRLFPFYRERDEGHKEKPVKD